MILTRRSLSFVYSRDPALKLRADRTAPEAPSMVPVEDVEDTAGCDVFTVAPVGRSTMAARFRIDTSAMTEAEQLGRLLDFVAECTTIRTGDDRHLEGPAVRRAVDAESDDGDLLFALSQTATQLSRPGGAAEIRFRSAG